MKLFFRITFRIFLIVAILTGCKINEEISYELYDQGTALLEEGQYDRAIAYFDKAIDLNPKYAPAYKNRGIAYFFKRDYEKAWDDVHKAQNLGNIVHPGFLKSLREASGRQE